MNKKIEKIVDDLTIREQISLWNQMCEADNWEDKVYYMSELENIIDLDKPYREVVENFAHGFDHNKAYVYWHLGELHSTNDTDDVINSTDLANFAERCIDEDILTGIYEIDYYEEEEDE